MEFSELYPGRYFKSESLMGKPRLLKIVDVERQTLTDGSVKTVITFEDEPMQLIANLTNGKAIKALYGSNTDSWIGKPIELYATTTPFGSKMVDCVRVRAPQRRQSSGNQAQPSRPKTPEPPLADAVEPYGYDGPSSADENEY